MPKPNVADPFESSELGTIYAALEYMLLERGSGLLPETILKEHRLLAKIRTHFIAAGGDPQELED